MQADAASRAAEEAGEAKAAAAAVAAAEARAAAAEVDSMFCMFSVFCVYDFRRYITILKTQGMKNQTTLFCRLHASRLEVTSSSCVGAVRPFCKE